jgi:hypothetical protein
MKAGRQVAQKIDDWLRDPSQALESSAAPNPQIEYTGISESFSLDAIVSERGPSSGVGSNRSLPRASGRAVPSADRPPGRALGLPFLSFAPHKVV